MKKALALLLAGVLLRDTNSRAAAKRGLDAYAKRDYATAVSNFRHSKGPLHDFNLGTAEVAAGSREDGSQTLTRAMRDLHVRQAALYNRGNAALASNAFDYAIRDYIEALRLKPSDLAAKRNLEIALRKKAQQDQQQQNAGGRNQQQAPAPSGGPAQPKGDADLEALLRSVQQQEQEEIARMRALRVVRGHVGW